MEYKNFTLYKPVENIDGVFYLKSESNTDWYEAQKYFSAETLKIAYDGTGRICIADTDASAIWPINLSISEVSLEDIPDNFSTNGKWKWDGEHIISTVTITIAKKNKIENIKNTVTLSHTITLLSIATTSTVMQTVVFSKYH